jgi:hypothetical protein
MNVLTNDNQLPRRTFLRGLGTAVALPLFEAMLPSDLLPVNTLEAATRKGSPRRMAFLYVPNGMHMKSWSPVKEGALKTLPSTLDALKPFRRELLVLGGLTQDKARANGDGPGDHARAAAAFLTGAQPYKTGGKSIKVGVSVDQIAAARLAKLTAFPSLELGIDRGKQSGSCDSGYSCAYSNNISWKTQSLPMAKETNPRLLFERLFPSISLKKGGSTKGASDPIYEKSILDYVLRDASALRKKLGVTDTRKLDEYLTAIREIEGRVARAEKEAKERLKEFPTPRSAVKLAHSLPSAAPRDYAEHVRLMGDLMVVAFQADLTRVVTFMFANEGSNRSYKEIGVADGHHQLSHHGGKKDKQKKIEKINRYQMDQFAYIVKRLGDAKEGRRSLLDQCMVLYGSGISDGNRHNHSELPILIAGRGGGTIKTGRYVRFAKNTPLNNLFLSLLDRMEVPCQRLGDSTGRLKGL